MRELRNVVQRAYVMADEKLITSGWLPTNAGVPLDLVESAAAAPPPAMAHEPPSQAPRLPVPPVSRHAQAITLAAVSREAGTARSPASLTVALGSSLAEVERQFILATFNHFYQHKERTAAALGVSMKTLYNRLKEYGPQAPDAGEPEEPSKTAR